MIKRILVPLDPSPFTNRAVQMGCRFAKLNHAEATGLVILDVPGIENHIGPFPLGASSYAEKLEAQKLKEAETLIQSLLNQFIEACEKAKVKHHEAEHQGSPSEVIIQMANYYDLVVMGLRTFYHFETQSEAGDTLDQVLNQSVTPIYGVTEMPPEQEHTVSNVVMAYDGSLLSIRALKQFIHTIVPDQVNLKLVTSHPDQKIASQYLDFAEAYCRAYGLKKTEKEWTSQDIIEAVQERLMDWADLFVVGAHSKKGLLDFMVGSLTKYLIKEAKKPVFIGQ